MKDSLLKRQAQAEEKFNALKSSVDAIKAELQKYGMQTVIEAEEELRRLQGDFRTIQSIIADLPEEKPKKSKKANVIDATEVEGA